MQSNITLLQTIVSISNNNKGTRDQLTGNASHSQHCKDVIKFPVQINPKDNFIMRH